jgi:hypothetical protein
VEFVKSPLRVGGQSQDLLGIGLHNAARFGQDDAFSHSLEKWDSQLFLENLHAFADGRLTDVEHLPSGAREVARRGNGIEDLKTVGIHLL